MDYFKKSRSCVLDLCEKYFPRQYEEWGNAYDAWVIAYDIEKGAQAEYDSARAARDKLETNDYSPANIARFRAFLRASDLCNLKSQKLTEAIRITNRTQESEQCLYHKCLWLVLNRLLKKARS